MVMVSSMEQLLEAKEHFRRLVVEATLTLDQLLPGVLNNVT